MSSININLIENFIQFGFILIIIVKFSQSLHVGPDKCLKCNELMFPEWVCAANEQTRGSNRPSGKCSLNYTKLSNYRRIDPTSLIRPHRAPTLRLQSSLVLFWPHFNYFVFPKRFKTFKESVHSFGVFLIICAVKSDVLCRRKRIRTRVRGRPAAVCTPRCPKPSRPSSLKNWPRRRATWVHTQHTHSGRVCVWTRRAAGLCSTAWGLRHRPTKSCWNPTRLNAPQTSVRTVETRSDTQKGGSGDTSSVFLVPPLMKFEDTEM